MTPKGKLIAIGGSVEKDIDKIEKKLKADFRKEVILDEMIRHAGGNKSRFEIITSATDEPEEAAEVFTDIFKKMGGVNLGVLDIHDRQCANDPENLKRLEQANLLLFTGGDQNQIIDYLKDTKTHELISVRYKNDDFVIAGSSAGAAMMGEKMIEAGKKSHVLKKNDLKTGEGLGFIKELLFDTHFIQRGRFERLAEGISVFPDKLGIGLGEDTAMVIENGNECEVIGSGMVSVIDGNEFDYDHYEKLKDGSVISLINLKVHILSPHDKFYIRERKAESVNDSRDYK
jgi:cyanophycinase